MYILYPALGSIIKSVTNLLLLKSSCKRVTNSCPLPIGSSAANTVIPGNFSAKTDAKFSLFAGPPFPVRQEVINT